MRKHLLFCGLAMAMAATPAFAAPWVKSFVVSAYEPAFYYGGKPEWTTADLIEPGSDCRGGTSNQLDYVKVMKTPWRSDADVKALDHPDNTDGLTIHYLQERGLSYRGFRWDIESYINPFAAPDPGMPQVTGKIAEGFNLDGDARTGGFISPDGQKGIDNAYYRAWGCIASFRGLPYHAQLSIRTTDKMLEGLYTIVVRVSGNKDPMNDVDATFEIGYSPDHPVKGGNDHVVGDFSFRMVKSAEYTRLKAHIKNGVVETEPVDELHVPKFAWFPDISGDADIHKGRVRLTIAKDGTASGLMGGYRDWRELYAENTFAQSGGTQETREHHNSIGMYYALQRNADGMPDPKTGRNMGISIAYRFQAMPAYVLDPAKALDIHLLDTDKRQLKKFKIIHDAFVTAVATRAIQPNPPGSSEGATELIQRADGSWTNNSAADAPKGVKALASQPPKPGKFNEPPARDQVAER